MMAVAAAQKNREMFAIKKSYSIEVSPVFRLMFQSAGLDSNRSQMAAELAGNVAKFVGMSGTSVL